MEGTITVTERRGATIHTYIAPELGTHVNTHLIELPTQLIAVDAQFALPHAREVVDYAATLAKPITRLYITHEHPDHFLGAEVFGAPVYALAEVKRVIDAQGDAMAAQFHTRFGDIFPTHATRPEHLVEPGEETIEGVRLVFRRVEGSEANVLLTVGLPDQGVIITQDLVYNQIHPFIANRTLGMWVAAIHEYKQLPYDTVLPGHGAPGDRNLYDQVLDYLAAAEPALASATTGAELKDALLERFPEYGGAMMLDIQNTYLFPTPSVG
jgi:glyoxylase-like metal-dependent hydrolase (beta-lactamase superfamily II)